MKKFLLKSMLVAAGLSASVQVMAEGYDFCVDGIYYNVTSKENLTVEVTNSLGGQGGVTVAIRQSDYKGDVTFPATVTYNDTTYAVKSIGTAAFSSSIQVTSVIIPATIDTLKESSLRTVLAYNENGELVRLSHHPPKVVIEYGETPLYGGDAAISPGELYVNREMKWYNAGLVWGKRIVYDSKRIEFGDSVKVIDPYLFSHNESLTEVKFPNHSFSFNAYVNPDYNRNYGVFEGCSALEKVDLSNLVPASSYWKWNDGNVNKSDGTFIEGGYSALTSATYSYYITPRAFKGCTALKEVILPDTITYERNVNLTSYNIAVGESAFDGCSSLQNIDLPVFVGSASSRYNLIFGGRAFAGTALTTVDLPGSITVIGDMAFADCASLSDVKFPYSWEWRKPNEQYAYGGSNLYLGDYVFENCTALKSVDLGGFMTYLPNTIFDGCAIEEVVIPASITYLSTTGMKGCNMSSITLDAANTTYKFEDNMLLKYDAPETTWMITIGNPYTGASALKNDTVNVLSAGLYEGLPIESFDFPSVYSYGARSMAGTNIKSVHIKDSTSYLDYYGDTAYTSVVYYAEAFADCKSLEECTIDPDVTSLPNGLFKNCPLITTAPEIPAGIESIPAELFYGTAISEITIGEKVKRLYENALPAGMTDITLYVSIPPAVTEADSVEWIVNTTIVVPSACVEMYAAHKFWGRAKEIIGNADYEGYGYSGYIQPAPDGLYFAEKDGNICYFDGENVIDTHIPAGSHTFQLASWHGAIYGVTAGSQYTYVNDTDNTLGDGELFVLNKRETGFSRSTIVNNTNQGDGANYQAYNDPYLIYIDDTEDKIYFANRCLTSDLGVRVFDAHESYDAPFQTSDEIRLFVYNSNMPYYNKGVAYGAIHTGFQKDSEGVYWHAFDYSGNGIYRYKASDIYEYNNTLPYPIIAEGSKFTAMYLDEPNDYIYVFSRTNPNHGVYRMSISAIRNGESTTFPRAWELVDGSLAAPENTTVNEGVYVRQFTSDGNYVYWAYITDGTDPNTPSGIKRVNATGSPVVEYVVKDVEAYGICHYKYDGSLGVESVVEDVNNAVVKVGGNTITALQDTVVEVYSINGSLVKSATLSAGSTMTINYTPGVYIVKAGIETHKIILK